MNNLKIDSKDISVIVRGLIVNDNGSDEKKKFTKISLESLRKYLPEAQIILSSSKGSDVSGLDYDVLVLSDNPERIDMAISADDTSKTKLMTTNYQILFSQKGLEKADRPYTLNIRSDIILTGTGFIKYFIKYNKNKDSDILKNKIAVLPTVNPRKTRKFLSESFLFDVCDWFYFGSTEDMKNIFDIPLMDKNKLSGEKINGFYLVKNNIESEQYIWTSFLKKYQEVYLPNLNYFSEDGLKLSEESYAKNTIMVPANKAQIKCLKMPNAGYGSVPFLSQGLYTFNEYKKMYNTYNKNKILIIPNPIENALYFIFFNLRQLLKKKTPGVYKTIVNFVRKCNGSYNLLK